jgi:hypothetical protein
MPLVSPMRATAIRAVYLSKIPRPDKLGIPGK